VVQILRSPLLERFPHGFTTRLGGVSRPPFEGLNLGDAVGDDPAAVEANWAALRAATGLAFARVRQVHGDAVVLARRWPGAPPARADLPEGDAVLSATPGLAACVAVADCVPLLVADPRGGAVAAVHAGWRGSLARVAARAVEALAREAGARPGDLLAAIGPSIGPCCYEVAEDLAARFAAAFGDDVVERRDGAPRLDLWRANERALREAGLRAGAIDRLARCTACEPGLLFSHRRDRGSSGRQVGFVAPGLP
jgi:YfiH family protein